jgi:hypothetical protein
VLPVLPVPDVELELDAVVPGPLVAFPGSVASAAHPQAAIAIENRTMPEWMVILDVMCVRPLAAFVGFCTASSSE